MGVEGLAHLPWRRILDYLLEVEGAQTPTEFCRRAFDAVQRIIPYDVSAGFFDQRTTRIVVGNGLPDSAQRAYNAYFHSRQPCVTDEKVMEKFASSWRLCWNDYTHTEYVTDFARPNGLVFIIAAFQPQHRFSFCLNRSRWAPPFSDRERGILAVINPHLDRLMKLFDRLQAASRLCPCWEEIVKRFPRLSRREAEVLCLLVAGMTAPEIASRLFISDRTVEYHLQGIYAKLDVHTKRQAIDLVSGRECGVFDLNAELRVRDEHLADWWSLDS